MHVSLASVAGRQLKAGLPASYAKWIVNNLADTTLMQSMVRPSVVKLSECSVRQLHGIIEP